MSQPDADRSPAPPPGSRLDEAKLAQLRAEAKAPYRGLRRFIYLACGASALIGSFIFLMQFLAGTPIAAVGPNLAIQLGVLGLVVWLGQIDRPSEK